MLTLDFKIITKSIYLLNGFSIDFPFSGDREKKVSTERKLLFHDVEVI